MNEMFLWFFVVVTFALSLREDEMNATWYLIYLYYFDDHGNLRKLKRPVDGVNCVGPDTAIEIAASRNDYRVDEHFRAEWCSTVTQRIQASELDGRHTCDWWSKADFVQYMKEHSFQGGERGRTRAD